MKDVVRFENQAAFVSSFLSDFVVERSGITGITALSAFIRQFRLMKAILAVLVENPRLSRRDLASLGESQSTRCGASRSWT